ncbi:MAG TPA: glycine cleavage system protein GcvH [Acidimicrobiales bacterium]|nr:glycine cleavage system protein GcvH [Acidimicrobiales bacterium]
MNVPEDLLYTSDHEWVRVEGDRARVGITDFAQDALGDVVYVGLPDVGAQVTAGAVCGEVESTKSVSEIYAPLSGVVVEVNAAVADNPETVNADPYGNGWMFVIEQASPDTGELLSPAAYTEVTST